MLLAVTALDGIPGSSSPRLAQATDVIDESQQASVSSPAVVDTGDAVSTGDVENTANTNETTTEGESSLTIDNSNTTESDTELSSEAGTGDNTAAGENGASITTGNAIASGNVVNVINTNIINANGLIYFLNVLFGSAVYDMRTLFSVFSGGSAPADCSLSGCVNGDATVSITNQNVAHVANDVTVGATTGGNSADGGTGTGTITTGDAYASANVINLVNTNLINSNYLLLSINNFGSLMHDIVFPGAEFFTDIFRSNATLREGSSLTVTNDNSANVENEIEVAAQTGDNSASGTDSTITTGSATAAATVVNQVNQNLLGDSLLFLFRIHGTWTGNIFGLPEGMAWRETGDGIELLLSPTTSGAPSGSTTIANTNHATVTNNISVYALTGDNEATGDGAQVATGDAYAAANVVNVVNTNVVGRNWVLAIINIFGDWGGNIAFGRPDLWVGARAIMPAGIRAGECFSYEVTINNFGDSAATNVQLTTNLDQAKQVFSGFDRELPDRLVWDLGRISAGGTKQLTIPVCLSRLVRGGDQILTDFVVDAHETDANDLDNREEVLFSAAGFSGGQVLRLGSAKLAIEKIASERVIQASSSVEYTITITNTGDPVYNALLVDTIYGANGKPIHEQRWGLDTILADETIIISYEAFFAASTTPGTYTNEAFISGTERHPDYKNNYGSPVDSPVAAVEVEIRGVTNEEPPIEPSERVCVPLITSYIRPGTLNDQTDVSKLQFFLRTHEDDARVSLTGSYDLMTEVSVRDFQERYRTDILSPWGIGAPTGYVYYTTQKKINELWCEQEFPLSPEQLGEIDSFKNRVIRYEAAGVPIPENDLREVGMNTDDMGTRLAAVSPTPIREEDTVETTLKPATETRRDQLAGAADAARSAGGLMGQVRAKLRAAFSWIGL